MNDRFTLNCPGVVEYVSKPEKGVLPIHSCSEMKDRPLAKLARRLYCGELSREEIEALSAEDRKIAGYIWALRALGLMRKQGSKVVLTGKALAYGSHATKEDRHGHAGGYGRGAGRRRTGAGQDAGEQSARDAHRGA